MTITSANARALVVAALDHAETKGLAISVAVLDSAGFLVAFGRTDGAKPYTVDVARGKAYTVVFMGRSSSELRDLAEKRPYFFGAVSDLGRYTIIPSPGGMEVMGGAIGVSGAPNPDQDVEVASAAIEAVKVHEAK